MTDNNRFIPPKSTVELLENVPESALRRLKQYSGRLATEAVHVMEERLPFFADLEASQRASVQLVVQTAVVNFVEWMRNPQQRRQLHRAGLRSGAAGSAPAYRAAPVRRDGARHDGVLRGSGAPAGPLRRTADGADGGHPALQPRPGLRRRHRLRRSRPRSAAPGTPGWRPTSSTRWYVATSAPNCSPRPPR